MTTLITTAMRNAIEITQRAPPIKGFLRLHQIVQPDGPLPISKSGFWAGVKSGKFPQPRKISPRVTVWRVEDINALIAKIENGEM